MTHRECSECGRFHAVPDIGGDWARYTPIKWRYALCLIGLHRWEKRQTCPYRDGYYDGNIIVTPNMELRDQCGRCGVLRP